MSENYADPRLKALEEMVTPIIGIPLKIMQLPHFELDNKYRFHYTDEVKVPFIDQENKIKATTIMLDHVRDGIVAKIMEGTLFKELEASHQKEVKAFGKEIEDRDEKIKALEKELIKYKGYYELQKDIEIGKATAVEDKKDGKGPIHS